MYFVQNLENCDFLGLFILFIIYKCYNITDEVLMTNINLKEYKTPEEIIEI